MAYNITQLTTFFTNANAGTGPTTAQTSLLQSIANQNATGTFNDTQAFQATVDLASDTTTAVSVETYAFFLGFAPSKLGLASLNSAYVGSGAQANLNGENRFIAQAVSLALQNPTAKSSFAGTYGSLSVVDATKAAYNIVVGNTAAAAAGINVDNAVAYLTSAASIAYYTAFVKANVPGLTAAADIDLAVKAAIVGEIMYQATSYGQGAGVGSYAAAANNLLKDLADDNTLTADNSAGIDLFANYGGSGTPGSSFNLTTAIDTLVGTGNNDTFNGQVNATDNTVGALDSIDGGAGTDTLNLADAVGATLDASLLTVKNVEIVNLTSKTGLAAGALDVSGWTGLTNANVVLQDVSAGDQTITASGATAVVVTASKQGASDITVQGGGAVTVATTGGVASGNIVVGSVTAPTGVVTVKATSGAYADAALTLGTIAVTGGTTVNVTESVGITAAQATAASTDTTNFTVTQGAVSVTGTASTATVSVTQDAAVAVVAGNVAGDGKIGVATGAVTITDVNAASATKAGTINTVNLTNGTQTVTSNALTALNLTGTNTTTVVLNNANTTTSKALAIGLTGGTSSVDDTNDVLTSATVSATGTAALTLSADSVTSLNLGGSKALTFTVGSLGALKTVNITGAGGVTSVLSGVSTLTKIDASASTGANAITINGATAKIAYIGGAGSDSLTLTGVLDANASIQLGAGNDRLLSNGATIGASTTAVVDGGDGIDAISSALISAVNASVFKNFEVLNLQSTGGDIVDVSLLTGSTITGLELNGGVGPASYSNVATSQSLAVTGTSGAASAATLVFTGVTGTADSYSINFNAAVTGTATSPTTVNARAVSIEGIENVSIASGSASGVAANAISLSDAAARTLTVTGSQALSLTLSGFGTAGTNGANIDASAATGAITINGLAGVGLVDGGSTIKTGAGADLVTVGAITGQVIVSTGGGKDIIDVSTTVGTFGSGATAAQHVTVNDFSSSDALRFKDAGVVETFASTKVDLTGVNDFAAALNAAAAGATVGNVTWFQYGNNTYVVQDNNASGSFQVGTDIVVKLTGLVDLSTAVLGNTSAATGPTLTLI